MKRFIAVIGCRPPRDFIRTDPIRLWPKSGHLFENILQSVRDFVEALDTSVVVVSGGAQGVDEQAARTARMRGMTVIEHLPNYALYGSGRAPLERNALIIRDAQVVHYWPAPWSRGTWHAVGLARKAGIEAIEHEVVL